MPLHNQAPGRAREVGYWRLKRLTRRRAQHQRRSASLVTTASRTAGARLPKVEQQLQAHAAGDLGKMTVALRAGVQRVGQAGCKRLRRRGGSSPVELPVASGLLPAEEVSQRRAARLLHVPEEEQRTAGTRLRQRTQSSQPRAAARTRNGGSRACCGAHSGNARSAPAPRGCDVDTGALPPGSATASCSNATAHSHSARIPREDAKQRQPRLRARPSRQASDEQTPERDAAWRRRRQARS